MPYYCRDTVRHITAGQKLTLFFKSAGSIYYRRAFVILKLDVSVQKCLITVGLR